MVTKPSVEVITEPDRFLDLREEWDDLLLRSRSSSVFLTWEWLHAWWQHFGGDTRVRIVTVRDGGRLAGALPLCVHRIGRVAPVDALSFMGTLGLSSEYLDAIAEPGSEPEVLALLLDLARGLGGSWQYAVFSGLLDSGVVLQALRRALHGSGPLVTIAPFQACPYLPLPADRAAFLDGLGSETRATLKRRTRRLAELGAENVLVRESGELPEAFSSLFQLHQKRWTLRGRTGSFGEERARRFHLDVAGSLLGKGWLRLYVMKISGVTIASLYCLQFKGKVFYFQAGFDPQWGGKSPGAVLMGHAIQDCIDAGLGEFDFLRGLEPYKYRWTEKVRPTWCLTVVPQGSRVALLRLEGEHGLRATRRFVAGWIPGRWRRAGSQ